MAAPVGTLTIEMAANIARLQKDMSAARRSVDGAMSDITRSAAKAQQSIEGIGSSISRGFSRVGDVIKGAFAVTAVYQFTQAIIEAGVAMQRLEKQFMAAFGSKQLGAGELEFLRGVVQRLGLDFVETAGAYAKFSAALKNTALEGAGGRGVFQGFATAATALSLSPAEFNSVMLALQQMMSKGCHAKGSLIRMADGSAKKVEDIEVGEHLLGPDGKPREVLILANGYEPMYKVTPVLGEPFVVNVNHILRVFNKKSGEEENIVLSEYLEGDKENYLLINVGEGNIEFSVAYHDYDEFFGFMIEGDHLYQDAQGYVHHNTVMAEEMRLQLNERLPGAYQAAARVMGMTTKEFSKQMELGNIIASELLPKMAAEFEKTYGEAAVEGAKMAQAEFSRLANLMFELRQSASKAFMPGLLAGIRLLTDNINATKDAIIALTQAAGAAATGAFVGWIAKSVAGFIAARTAAIALAQSTALAASSAMGMSLALNASATAAAAAAAKYTLASTAAGIATRAMGLLGGPIGVIITLLGTAAAAWGFYASRQEEAAKTPTGADKVIADLEEEIKLLKERRRLREEQGDEVMDMPQIDDYMRARRALEVRLSEIRTIIGASKPGQLTVDSPILREYRKAQEDLERLEKALDDAKAERSVDALHRMRLETAEAKANYESVALKVERLNKVLLETQAIMDKNKFALDVPLQNRTLEQEQAVRDYYKAALQFANAKKELENAAKGGANKDDWEKVARQLQNDMLKNSLSPLDQKLADISAKAAELRAKHGDKPLIAYWEEEQRGAAMLDAELKQLIETRKELDGDIELSTGSWDAFKVMYDTDPLKEYREKYGDFTADVMVKTEELSEFQAQAMRNMQDAAANFFEDVLNGNLDSLEDYVSAFGKAINRMVAEYLAQMALMSAVGPSFMSGGPMGGWLGTAAAFGASLLGGGGGGGAGGGGFSPSLDTSSFNLGFRAEGGPVLPNKPYIVGERGPELMVPRAAGQIIPNNQLNNNLTFSFTIGDENRHLISQLESKVAKTVHEVLRNAS